MIHRRLIVRNMAAEVAIRRQKSREETRRREKPICVNKVQTRRTRHDLFLIFQENLSQIQQPVRRTCAGTFLLRAGTGC